MLAAPNRAQVVENLMGVGVWRVALVIKLDVRSGVEGAWVHVVQKETPFDRLELPWGRFGCHFRVRRCYFFDLLAKYVF